MELLRILVGGRVVSGPVYNRGDVIFEFDSPMPDSEKVDVQVKTAIQIAFEEIGGLKHRDVIRTLEEILKFVRHRIFPGFEPFFDPDANVISIPIRRRRRSSQE